MKHKILTLLVCVFIISFLFLTLFAQDNNVVWQREIYAEVNGQNIIAYSAAMNDSKPTFADIDNDGDYDLFIGEDDGNINFYRNDGTAENPSWTLITENYNFINVGGKCTPVFADIDNDYDLDLFVGIGGKINFFINNGTPQIPSFKLVTINYFSIDVGSSSAPAFADIDNDNDLDLFIGERKGNINFYRNDGTPQNPSFILVTENYNSINVFHNSAPAFSDIDNDGDQDLFIGQRNAKISYYRNDGTADSPSWIPEEDIYIGKDVDLAPTFIDIDNDGDLDLFIGGSDGQIIFYENDGTANNPSWNFITENYTSILDFGAASIPTFVDIDNDGDLDLFVGSSHSGINYYRNDGTASNPSWTFITQSYNSIYIGSGGAASFADIDNDKDFDLFIGQYRGNLHFYRNDGTLTNPTFSFVTENYNSIKVSWSCIPTFADIDNDRDLDLFVGEIDGNIHFYQNDGTPNNPSWTYIDSMYNSIDIGQKSAPTFVDIDNDGDLDLFVGTLKGNLHFYRNEGTSQIPSWILVAESYNSINVEGESIPTFVDIDDDSDFDLFIGRSDGGLDFWRNLGTTASPDLLFETITAPRSGGIGNFISIFNTIINQGHVFADTFTVKFYLSRDAQIDDHDAYLGYRTVPGLDPGSRSSDNTILTIPSGLDTEHYYIGAKIDPNNRIPEYNEANNTGCDPNKIWITKHFFDLTVISIDAPNECITGYSISVYNSVKNLGQIIADSFKVDFYLSFDRNITNNDINLGSITVYDLEPGSRASDNTVLNIPLDINPGAYWLGLIVDPDELIQEDDEENNTAYDPDIISVIKLLPDLIVEFINAPNDGVTGHSILAYNKVKNEGLSSADSFKVAFYLSVDRNITTNDIYLDSRTVYNLEPGSSSAENTVLIIPSVITPGAYYLGVVVDPDGLIQEENEENNISDDSINISLNSSPVLSNGKVKSELGSYKSEFSFTVIYTDADGDPPSNITVKIDDDVPIEMIKQGSNDYINGVVYVYKIKLSLGNHNYAFNASDGITDASGDTNIHLGPIVIGNAPPVLSNSSLTPHTGNISTEFIFKVTYTDIDRELSSINVIIDDSITKSMNPSNTEDISVGRTFECKTTLSVGEHTYRFLANDGLSDAIGDTCLYFGPVVTKIQSVLPIPGQWNGKTNQQREVSFNVSEDSSSIQDFRIKVELSGCVGLWDCYSDVVTRQIDEINIVENSFDTTITWATFLNGVFTGKFSNPYAIEGTWSDKTLGPQIGPNTWAVLTGSGNWVASPQQVIPQRGVEINEPINGAIVKNSQVTVKGKVFGEKIAYAELNEVILELLNGTFSINIELHEGRNSIILRAFDENHDILGLHHVNVILDTEAPVISITQPVDSFITSRSEILVEGHVGDPLIFEIDLNGSPIPVREGKFAAIVALNEGTNNILLKATDNVGNIGIAKIIVVRILESSVERLPRQITIPEVFSLRQNFPNPFNCETMIEYQLPIQSEVKLEIYNILGRLVRTLVSKKENCGYQSVRWNGMDEQGRTVTSGVYLYSLRAGEFVQVRKMILIR